MEKKIQDFPFPGRYISRIRPGMWRQSVRYQRILATLLGASFLWSVEAPGLGLGEVELNSYLNQPLSAEIALLAVDTNDLEQITVKLANQAAFDAAGIERFVQLEDLVFEVRKSSSGSFEVGVTTKNNIKEPFLDFIVEVVWPNGRLLREYTLLLDPPVFTSQQAGAISAPEMGFTVHNDEALQQGVTQTQTQTQRSSSTNAASVQQAPTQAAASAASFSNRASNSNVDPLSAPTPTGELRVRRNENLWSVAEKILPNSGFSVEQRMLGIFKINNDAFIDSNINNLKAGYVLREPSQAVVAELSHGDAANLARQHYQAWLSAKRLGAANTSRVADASPGPVGLAENAVAPPSSARTAQGRLSLVSPEESGSSKAATGANQGGLSSSDLALVMDQEKESKAETDSLKTKITALEEQLAMMERLITLKDDALVEMQRQLGGSDASMPESQAAVAELTEVAPVEVLAPQVVEVSEVPVAQVDAPVEAAQVKKPLQVVEPVQEESSLLGMLLNPQILMLGVGILLVIAAALMVIRKRKQQSGGEDFQEHEFVPEYDDTVAAGGAAVVGLNKTKTRSDDDMDFSSITDDTLTNLNDVDEFSGVAMDSLQTEESDIDPIAEADVYLAYRRFQQAEDLIKDAMHRHPERNDLQVKLLEIYFAADNKAGFEAQAEALFASLGGQENSVWAPVAEMGRELCQGHPLFGGSGSGYAEESNFETVDTAVAAATDSADLSNLDDFSDELDFSSLSSDLDEVTESRDVSAEVKRENNTLEASDDALMVDADNSLNFDELDVFSSVADEVDDKPAEKKSAVEDGVANQIDDMDFDFDTDFDAVAERADSKEASDPLLATTEDNALAFDSELSSEKKAAQRDDKVEALDEVAAEFNPLDDGLADFDVAENLDSADSEIGALSFEALGTEVQSNVESIGEKVEAVASFDSDPLAEGIDDLLSFDSLEETATTAEQANPLDDADFSLPEPVAKSDDTLTQTVDASLASFEEEGDNIMEELSQSYGELEEVFTGMADADINSADDDLFGGADMIGTKLDLARAYIDMEDNEGARGILQEVLEEGSDAQKQEAQEMMQKIG